ncbi:MAG: response regulator transcription factor [Caldilineaceae bacterium]
MSRNGREAIAQAETLAPDVVLMDINMPDVNGIEATQQLLAVKPETGIVMLTMLEDNDSLFAAMCAGAGYILKGADKAEVLHHCAVAEGEALFGPAIAGRLTAFFQRTRSKTPHDPTLDPFPELTDRERDVLELIAYGANNQEIAQRLHISAKTVSNHISNIFNKLQVVDRAGHCHRRQAGLGDGSRHAPPTTPPHRQT